jgi:hypothetical protein
MIDSSRESPVKPKDFFPIRTAFVHPRTVDGSLIAFTSCLVQAD